MSVITASVRTPAWAPIATIDVASARASDCDFMNAPSPHLTSRSSAVLPSASFLLMIEAEMRGTLSTVPVTSRKAYSALSAGTSDAVCPMMLVPTVRSASLNSSTDRPTRNPGIDSSLSSVPPVCPSPRPDIFGTMTPQDAASGASAIDTLSPTPPVLCLPTFTPGNVGEIHALARPQHRVGEPGGFLRRHAPPHDRHQERRYLVVGDRAVAGPLHERVDGFPVEGVPVALPRDDVGEPHQPGQYTGGGAGPAISGLI